jgi:hypothetical protein
LISISNSVEGVDKELLLILRNHRRTVWLIGHGLFRSTQHVVQHSGSQVDQVHTAYDVIVRHVHRRRITDGSSGAPRGSARYRLFSLRRCAAGHWNTFSLG